MRPYDILHVRKPPAVTHKVPTSPHSDIFIARLGGHGKHDKYFGHRKFGTPITSRQSKMEKNVKVIFISHSIKAAQSTHGCRETS